MIWHQQHPGTGLPCPPWTECAICAQPMQDGGELYDDGWIRCEHLLDADGNPVCPDCHDELDLADDLTHTPTNQPRNTP